MLTRLQDVGLLHITEALLEQARHLRTLQDEAILAAVAAAAAEVAAAELFAAEVADDAADVIVARTADSNMIASPTPDDLPSTATSLSGELSASPSTQSLLECTSIDDDDDENDHGDVATELPHIVEPPKPRSTLESLLQTQKQQNQQQSFGEDGQTEPPTLDVSAPLEMNDTGAEPLTDIENNVANNNLNNNQMAAVESANADALQAIIAATDESTSPTLVKSPDGHVAAMPTFDLNENDPTAVADGVQLDNLPDGREQHQSELIEYGGDRKRTTDLLEQSSGPAALSVAATEPAAADDSSTNDLDEEPPVQIASSNNIGNKQYGGVDDSVPLPSASASPPSPTPNPSPSPAAPSSSSTPNPSRQPSAAIEAQLCSQLKQATISLVEEAASESVEPTASPLPLTSFHAMTVPTLTTANLKSLASATAGASQSGGAGNNGHNVLSTSLDSTMQMLSADDRYHGCGPERSYSLESLNSETSVDSNDSKSSLKLAEQKFNKNGTLERQQTAAAAAAAAAFAATAASGGSAGGNSNATSTSAASASTTSAINASGTSASAPPSGLQALILWNNGLTRDSAKTFGDLLAETTSLEFLNVGRNLLSNDFLSNVRDSLKTNTSLTSLGLQSAHLTCTGLRTLSECLEFGGNATLQRIDVRDNHLQVAGLTALNDVLKSNKTVTRVDLDDVPRRAHVSIRGR